MSTEAIATPTVEASNVEAAPQEEGVKVSTGIYLSNYSGEDQASMSACGSLHLGSGRCGPWAGLCRWCRGRKGGVESGTVQLAWPDRS